MIVSGEPKKPLVICVAETCDNSEFQNEIHCHYKLKDLVHFLKENIIIATTWKEN